MKLIVWLGNPGKEYAKTRHNIGFIMLDRFCDRGNYGGWKMEKNFHAEIIKTPDIIFCKPQTYMNKSWEAIKKIVDFYKIPVENILIIHDEIDLPTGTIQKKIGGSHAGHNGLRNTLLHLQNNNTFTRIRIWVDRPDTKEWVVDRVLEPFSKAELTVIDSKEETIFWYINEFIS